MTVVADPPVAGETRSGTSAETRADTPAKMPRTDTPAKMPRTGVAGPEVSEAGAPTPGASTSSARTPSAPTPGALAAGLDAFLGDPRDPGARVSLDVTLRRDRAAEFPAEAIHALDEWGMPRHYVPRALGGELDDLLTPLLLMRTVARRDVTAAVGHGKTVLGAISAWAAGVGSATRMAQLVADGAPVSWGLTEEGRGSDLAAAGTRARVEGDGIHLHGHKWPIGNATRGRAITVLARTDDRPGPRALSLVLVDKAETDAATLTYRERRVLHGIRGADISGVEFHDTTVPQARWIGAPGQGIEIVLKSLQVTRTLCAALSLGAGDQALEALVTGGVESRVVAESVADLLLAEAVAFAGTRVFHSAPAEMALTSAFVKVLVPDLVDGVIREGGAALGSAALLTDGEGARFEKAARDARVVSIFDGNSVVNLNVVINELPNLVRGEDDEATWLDDFEFAAPGSGPAGREFDMSQLRLVTRRGSGLLRALPDLAARLDDGRTHPDAARLAAGVVAAWRRLKAAAAQTERAARPPVSQFALAEQLAYVFAAASAIAVYLANRDAATGPRWHAGDGLGTDRHGSWQDDPRQDDLWQDDLWLRGALARAARRLGSPVGPLPISDLRNAASSGSASLLPAWRAAS